MNFPSVLGGNVTAIPYQNFNDSYVNDVNSYVTGVISLLSNCLLIYATSQVKSYTNSVRWSQYSISVLRIVFSLSIVLTCPSIEYVAETESLYIIKNGIDLPLALGESLLAVFIVAIVMSCNGPAVQYLQVTLLLSASAKSQSNSIIISLIPLLVAIPTVILVYFGYIPLFYDVQVADYLLERMGAQGSTSILVITVHLAQVNELTGHYDFDMMSQVCTFFILIVMFLSLLVIIVCYLSIRSQMKYQSGMGTGSTATHSTQEQLHMVLLIQFVFPFITIHIPFYITFILPFFNNEIEFLTDHMLYLFSWCPAISPILVILMVQNIREVVIPEKIVIRRFGMYDRSSSRVFTTRS
ncbi:unnamed protein product [Caenorhabditis sp. 36 PRJEB53466]|nr:unnamed protein product [Caenorhabditis sp. 36 PRJEB53466]